MNGRIGLVFLVFGCLVAAGSVVFAQSVSGTLFEDWNGNGILDEGEPLLEGVSVTLYGSPDAGGVFDQTLSTGVGGDYMFVPGNGCYLLNIDPGPDYRFTGTRQDLHPEGTTPFGFPVGMPRFGFMENGISNLRAGSMTYASMGDSIAYNWSSCNYFASFWYSRQVADRLRCVAPSASINLGDEN